MFKRIPQWMKMARDPESVGQQFMNFFGLQFEDIEKALEELEDNRFLVTANVVQPDIVYKIDLPSVLTRHSDIKIVGAGRTLTEVDTLKQFFATIDSYIIDYDKLVAYISHSYGEGQGLVEVTVTNGDNQHVETCPLELHHVWNALDEFGLLLDLPRLRGERNADYRKRLLDVFRYPSNATKQGLVFGIAKELGLIHHREWQDDSKPFVIDAVKLDVSTIKVDGINLEPDEYTVLSPGSVEIKPLNEGIVHDVSYIAGIQVHALNNKRDYAFQNTLYNPDGTATERLLYYVNRITTDVPIMWGSFLWDVGWWDSASKDLSGIEFIPNIWDPSIEGWKNWRGGAKD
jgi:hypothetical protein